MRIVIDTKHDSPEEIKHVINLLTAMLGQGMIRSEPSLLGTESEQTQQGDVFGNIFGPVKTQAGTEETKEAEEEQSTNIKDVDLDNLETY